VIVIKTEISNKPCHWEDDTIKTNYWWTISLDCIILSVTWFIRYLCFYYYHCVYTSTGVLLVLIVDTVIVIKTEISNKPCHWEDDTIKTNSPPVDVSTQYCIILSVTRFIRYLCFYYYLCVYTSTGGLLSSRSIDTVIVIKTEISNKPCQWEDVTIKTLLVDY
jgi:small-conductance mechanosensitive channel